MLQGVVFSEPRITGTRLGRFPFHGRLVCVLEQPEVATWNTTRAPFRLESPTGTDTGGSRWLAAGEVDTTLCAER